MRHLYTAETLNGVRAECRTLSACEEQAREYLDNCGGSIYIYHYIIENPDVKFQVENGGIGFYIDDNYIYEDEWEDYGIGRGLIQVITEEVSF